MVADDGTPSTEDIEERIQQVGRYSRFVKIGLGVILAAFVLTVLGRLPENLNSLSSAVDFILLPLIFVGMGLLLFGIGIQLHLMPPTNRWPRSGLWYGKSILTSLTKLSSSTIGRAVSPKRSIQCPTPIISSAWMASSLSC